MEYLRTVHEQTLEFQGSLADALRRCREGDERAQRELARQHTELAAILGLRLGPEWLPPEDAIQVALITMVRLAESGDPEFLVKLAPAIKLHFDSLDQNAIARRLAESGNSGQPAKVAPEINLDALDSKD